MAARSGNPSRGKSGRFSHNKTKNPFVSGGSVMSRRPPTDTAIVIAVPTRSGQLLRSASAARPNVRSPAELAIWSTMRCQRPSAAAGLSSHDPKLKRRTLPESISDAMPTRNGAVTATAMATASANRGATTRGARTRSTTASGRSARVRKYTVNQYVSPWSAV